ncbi:MAG: hypothetical protein ACRD1N_09840 [Terriglobia bacterium]
MHPNLSLTDWLNLSTLVGIFLVNLYILNLLSGKQASDAKVRDVFFAHGFWTATWLVWLFTWMVHFKTTSLLLADLLDDVGAFLLIAFAVTFVGGLAKLKTHWSMIAGFFVIDAVWLGTASVVIPNCVDAISAPSFQAWVNGMNGMSGMSAGDMIFHRTVVFAPSLCLVILALGLVAWSFIERFGEWQISGLMALLTAIYAVLHVALFQVNFFIPALNYHGQLEFLFIAWRIVLVLLYSILILSAVGVQVQLKRIIAVLGTVGSLISTIVSLWPFIFGK